MIQNSLCAFMGTASHPCVGQEMKSKSHHLSGGLKAFVGRVPEKFLSLFIMINDTDAVLLGYTANQPEFEASCTTVLKVCSKSESLSLVWFDMPSLEGNIAVSLVRLQTFQVCLCWLDVYLMICILFVCQYVQGKYCSSCLSIY